jgi:hypothetical protein
LGKALVTDFAFSSLPLSVQCAIDEGTGKYLIAPEPQSRNQSAYCIAQTGCRLRCSQSRRC